LLQQLQHLIDYHANILITFQSVQTVYLNGNV